MSNFDAIKMDKRHLRTEQLPPPHANHAPSKADLFVAAELRRVQQRAVVEELRDEFRSAHTSVAVGVGEHGGQRRHHQHLHDGVVTQSGRLAFGKKRKTTTTTTFNIRGR